jgi:2-methylthioadenine synthetase
VLLGQDVNAYNDSKSRLSNLIMEIEEIEDIIRIRYTTYHT